MSKKNRFPFTKTRLDALPIPQDKRVYYYDARTEGLAICITPAGTKTFYLYKWAAGRPVRIPLGRYPGMTVEQAQKAVKPLVAEIAQGHDPAIARQAVRHEQTIEGLWLYWLDNHAKLHKKSWKEDERTYRCFLLPWAKRRLSTIKKSDVQALHHRVAEDSGRYRANRVHELIRAMFNKAVDIGFDGPNPAIGIKRFPEEKRDRFLHGDELPRFFQSLMEEPNDMLRDFFFVCLLVGARRANVQTMAWVDVNFDAGIWRIPETKSGEPLVVPLCEAAMQLLKTRQNTCNGSPWVFPSRGKTGHLVEPKSSWKRIVKRAGLTDVRIHDLRRSLGSWQAMTGASLPIIGKSLGHKLPSTTAIYARLQVESVRQSVETAANAMLTAGGVKLLEVTDDEK